MDNPFFKRKTNIKINDILSLLNLKKQKVNYRVNDIKELETAKKNDITFFNSIKYLEFIKKTKSRLVITNKKFLSVIPSQMYTIEVPNVLLAVSYITSLFYPNSVNDNFDFNVSKINKNDFKNLKFGNNVLIGKNVKIGKNCSIGHNTIIEKKREHWQQLQNW